MLYLFSDDAVALPSFIDGTTEYLVEEEDMNQIGIGQKGERYPIEVCCETTLEMKDIQFKHMNIWDCVYEIVINKATVHVVYYKLNDKYFRAYKPSMEGFALKDDTIYKPIGSRIWGHVEIFQILSMCDRCEDKRLLTNEINSLVYFIDMELTEEEYERERKNPKKLQWRLLIDEIIADG